MAEAQRPPSSPPNSTNSTLLQMDKRRRRLFLWSALAALLFIIVLAIISLPRFIFYNKPNSSNKKASGDSLFTRSDSLTVSEVSPQTQGMKKPQTKVATLPPHQKAAYDIREDVATTSTVPFLIQKKAALDHKVNPLPVAPLSHPSVLSNLKVFFDGQCQSTRATIVCDPIEQSIVISYDDGGGGNGDKQDQMRIPRQMTMRACLVSLEKGNTSQAYAIEIYLFNMHWFAIVASDDNDNNEQGTKLMEVWNLFTPDTNPLLYKTRLEGEPKSSEVDKAILQDLFRMGIQAKPLNSSTKMKSAAAADGSSGGDGDPGVSEWRISTVNNDFAVCSSYPEHIATLTTVSDEDLQTISKFRSKGRFPILSYRSSSTGSVIVRSSQTRGYSNQLDQQLVDSIRQTSPSKKLLIMDARTAGYAYLGRSEITQLCYKECKKIYAKITDAHSLRKLFYKMFKRRIKGEGWEMAAKQSRWFEQVKKILSSVSTVVQAMDIDQRSVLMHCSEGWDRTSQLVSLASICLDSYYRSYNGLEVLLNREWVWAGHKLEERTHRPLEMAIKRTGYEDAKKANLDSYHSQWLVKNSKVFFKKWVDNKTQPKKAKGKVTYSPVFMLFLDCLGQLIQVHPDAFEYDTTVLKQLLEQLHTKRWENNEKERTKYQDNRPRFHLVTPKDRKEIKEPGVLAYNVSTLLANYQFIFA